MAGNNAIIRNVMYQSGKQKLIIILKELRLIIYNIMRSGHTRGSNAPVE